MATLYIIAVAACLWGALSAFAVRQTAPGFVAAAIWNVLGALLLGIGLAGFSFDGYGEDSFWTLALRDRFAVAGLAAALMLLGGWVAFRVACTMATRCDGLRLRVAMLTGNISITLACYFGLWFVSPQIFYSYYRLIFENLPQQWVIGSSAQLDRFVVALLFEGNISLADSAAGLYFWMLLSLTVFVHAAAWRAARRQP